MKQMECVVIESPYAGNGYSEEDIQRSLRYVRAVMHDCLLRGEAPFASHALYTQDGVLDDKNPDERKLGIEAGFNWGNFATKTIVYTDLGISKGMELGIERAVEMKREIVYRSLGEDWDK